MVRFQIRETQHSNLKHRIREAQVRCPHSSLFPEKYFVWKESPNGREVQ